MLVQKFVAESKGMDVRALVVGDRVVAAMRRVAEGQEFRSNIHRGGRAEPVELDPEYERTAVRAVQILGLKVAGVDLLESQDGPQVLEVNSSPGLQGIESTTGVDVATAILEYLEEQVTFPELDIRERLSLSKGFGVCLDRNFRLRGSCGQAKIANRVERLCSSVSLQPWSPNPLSPMNRRQLSDDRRSNHPLRDHQYPSHNQALEEHFLTLVRHYWATPGGFRPPTEQTGLAVLRIMCGG